MAKRLDVLHVLGGSTHVRLAIRSLAKLPPVTVTGGPVVPCFESFQAFRGD